MKTIVALGLALALATTAPAAQDPLSTAKDLYSSAAYEDALAALARIDQAQAQATPDLARQIEQYRVYCLYALGRTAEAESTAEGLIRKLPLVQLEDASPRIEAMFLTVRKRLLPSLIRAEYRTARSALDEKNFSKAEPHLMQAHKMLVAAQEAGALDEALADLSVLVDGFIELGRGAARVAPAEVSVQPAPAGPAVVAVAAPMREAAPNAKAAPSIYSTGDDGVVPPVATLQQFPILPLALRPMMRLARPTVVLDILIDETGAVQESVLRQPINPSYDTLLLTASRAWKYRPATKDGTPVKFRKLILVTITGD
jgi:hypothetical protein